MQSLIRLNQFGKLIIMALLLGLVVSCRTSDLISQFIKPNSNEQPIDGKASGLVAQSLATSPATAPSLPTATPLASITTTQPIAVTSNVGPTPLSPGLRPEDRPTYTPVAVALASGKSIAPVATQPRTGQLVAPTRAALPSPPPAVRAPVSAKTPTPTKIPSPPIPGFEYHVAFSWCGPNWLTFVEGTVTKNQIPQNGLLVRIALEPDVAGLWADYKTGTDPTKPGGYTQIIDANAPHSGLWYLWVVDPQTNKRISDITLVRTDPKHIDEGSCQSATVNFTN